MAAAVGRVKLAPRAAGWGVRDGQHAAPGSIMAHQLSGMTGRQQRRLRLRAAHPAKTPRITAFQRSRCSQGRQNSGGGAGARSVCHDDQG